MSEYTRDEDPEELVEEVIEEPKKNEKRTATALANLAKARARRIEILEEKKRKSEQVAYASDEDDDYEEKEFELQPVKLTRQSRITPQSAHVDMAKEIGHIKEMLGGMVKKKRVAPKKPRKPYVKKSTIVNIVQPPQPAAVPSAPIPIPNASASAQKQRMLLQF